MTPPPAGRPPPLRRLSDGTVKQVNPFTGTQVWTVPGRADRPLVPPSTRPAEPLEAADAGRYCAFCERRYLQTPPERERVVRAASGAWQVDSHLTAEQVAGSAADFRVFSNLFEIVSYDYWVANHGYAPSPRAARHQASYLATEGGRAHLRELLAPRHGDVADLDLPGRSERLFAGCHEVVVARRHVVDGATAADQLASSGTLTPDEHEQYVAVTVRAMRRLYDDNPHARLVAAFQNWLRPAGASFDHLHKQLVAIDEYGNDLAIQLARLESEPDLYERWGPRYAESEGLVIARADKAVAVAGVGHQFPGVEVWSTEPGRPWELSSAALRDLSDLLHAVHAATGADVPANEEWHHQPPDVTHDSPLRVIVKWRVSTLAGFEGGTKIYVNTLDPWTVATRVRARLTELLPLGGLGDVRVGP